MHLISLGFLIFFTTLAWARVPLCTQSIAQAALAYATVNEGNDQDSIEQAHAHPYDALMASEYPDCAQGDVLENEILIINQSEYDDDYEDAITKATLHWLGEMAGHFYDDPGVGTWKPVHKIYYKGVTARLYKHLTQPELILSFRGTATNFKNDLHASIRNIHTNLRDFLGKESSTYHFAADIAACILSAYPDYTLTCTGVSLGGGLAHFAAAMNGISAYCFNSPKLGKGHADTIFAHGNLDKASIYHLHIDGEILESISLFLKGHKFGTACKIPPHNPELNSIARHRTTAWVPALKDYIETLDKEKAG